MKIIPYEESFFDDCVKIFHSNADKYFADYELDEFVEFLEVLRGIHARGVSHGDLKSKGNIMVTCDEKPCVIDFGTAFLLKKGFHPINNWLFEYGARLDINAWVKHKYHGRYADASEEDRALLDYGRIELIARKISGRPMDAVSGKRKL